MSTRFFPVRLLVAGLLILASCGGNDDYGDDAHKGACGYLHFISTSLEAAYDNPDQARSLFLRLERTDPPQETEDDTEDAWMDFLGPYRQQALSVLAAIDSGESGGIGEYADLADDAWDNWDCENATELRKWGPPPGE